MAIILNGKQEQYKKAQESAKKEYNEQRVKSLCYVYYPVDKIHPEFGSYLKRVLMFASAKNIGLNEISWLRICSLDSERPLLMPEMRVCFEILDRCTPHELGSSSLDEFNQVDRKKVDEILYGNVHFKLDEKGERIKKENGEFDIEGEVGMTHVYNAIDFEVSKKIADKINMQKKLEQKIAIGNDIKFVVPNTTEFKGWKYE